MPAATTVTWKGKTERLDVLAKRFGLGINTVQYRLRAGWRLEIALGTPAGHRPAGAALAPQPSTGVVDDAVERDLAKAIAKESAPPWQRHPQPLTDVVGRAPKPGAVPGLGELLGEVEEVLLATVAVDQRRSRLLNRLRKWRGAPRNQPASS